MIHGKAIPINNNKVPVIIKTAEKLNAVKIRLPKIGPKIFPKKVVLFDTPNTFPRCSEEDERLIIELRNEMRELEWRLAALEKEQRLIREDILSGEAIDRMKKRLLTNPSEDIHELKKKINKQITIKL